ncbi:Crp/Fnr family transcriptional regulator [Acidovorax sp. Leaf76]|uniref:Crp/Fnr family transcriptional regulator n=1 Tax=unclassified Acidovorax TaxID=2684926 RepID=UPI000A9CE5D4
MGSEGSWCPKIFVRFLPDEYDCSHMETSSPEDAEDCIAPSDRAFGVTPSLRCLASGQMLFREGAASAGVFRLRSGCVRLIRTTLTGGQATMHTVRQGEFFAEASLFSAIYHCDAVALESSEVLVFRKQALVDQLRKSPELLWTFTAELARRVQGLRTRLEIKQTRSAEERILQFIGLHCDASGFWTQQGTLKHLSEDIGLTHEALYRALARLQRQGAILRLKNGLKICQPGVLAPSAERRRCS